MGRRPSPPCTAPGFPSLKSLSQIVVYLIHFWEVLEKVWPPVGIVRQ
jgi:hypothetical protein